MKLQAIILCASLSTLSFASYANTTLHHNEIVFLHEQESSGIATDVFLVDQHSVTNSQPSELTDLDFLPHWFKHHGNNGKSKTVFWINAGRHKSHDVFDALTQWGFDTSNVPNEMNFAVRGTLGFTLSAGNTYICKDIALAQTGIGLSNRWYTFSLNGSDTYHGTRYTDITCINTTSKALRSFRIISENDNTFSIRAEGLEI